MLHTLARIGEEANKETIIWGVGGSLLLYFHGLLEHPRDIDILVAERDAGDLQALLSKLGKEQVVSAKEPFRTKYFSKYAMPSTKVDCMGALAIAHDAGVYRVELTAQSIVGFQQVHGIPIPLCALEDWYVLYALMPDREDKVALLERYFAVHGIQHPGLFEQALQQPLPKKLHNRILQVIG